MEQNKLKITLLIFAKTIESGSAKSRIGALKGEKVAANVYQQLLVETAHLVHDEHYHVAYTGTELPYSLKNIFKNSQSFFPQIGETLGERLNNAYEDLFHNNYSHICTLGTDCPTLSVSDIHITYQKLEEGYDMVIGPAYDGGYYLIATNAKGLPLFHATGWSTSELYKETIDIAQSFGLRYYCLPIRNDIDYWEDYAAWKKGKPPEKY